MSRRSALQVLAAAAGAMTLAGCSRPAAVAARWLSWAGLSASHAGPAAAPFPVALFDATEPWTVQNQAEAAKALGAFDPSFAWQPEPTPAAYTSAVRALEARSRADGTPVRGSPTPEGMPKWGVAAAAPWAPPTTYAALDPAYRHANFPVGGLLPGAMQAFTAPRGAFGVPVAVIPTAIAYNQAAFAACGLSAPAADWTVADFETACAATAAAGKAGKLGPIRYALPPLVGHTSIAMPGPGHATLDWQGALLDPTIWGAFVVGYGGWSAKNGTFDLTNPGAVAGLQRLVSIAMRYGPPPSAMPRTWTEFQASQAASAMRFVHLSGAPAKGWAYARFPRLPVRPVVPITLDGVAPAGVAPGGYGWQPAYNPAAIPAEALLAVVRYAQWMDHVVATDPGAAAGAAPVTATASLQQRYWTTPQRLQDGSAAAADWTHFALVQEGWPPTPGTFLSGADTTVLEALTEAVTTPASLPQLLAATTQKLNAAAAHYAAAQTKG